MPHRRSSIDHLGNRARQCVAYVWQSRQTGQAFICEPCFQIGTAGAHGDRRAAISGDPKRVGPLLLQKIARFSQAVGDTLAIRLLYDSDGG